ncbi:NAD-dependent epimerase/dehydratase family protein [Cohnella hongkongensis]|uniref:NAD-dependent epimerase/dehydratase family protein n=1 Tax=Cohnella hongkongensis TaxID=178337 RepID=A0ABV9F6R3_9BACL
MTQISNSPRILITGASGYLARFVVERLARQGYRLRGFDRVTPSDDRPLHDFVQGDITSFEDIRKACEDQDIVIHLVSIVRNREHLPLGAFNDIMVKGTWNTMEAAVQAGVRKIVNISSILAIGYREGPLDKPVREDDPFRAGSYDLYYVLGKWLGEEIGRAYSQAYSVPVIHIRPGVIDGDGQNEPPSVPDNPDKHWFQYVAPEDLAQAIEGAVTTQRAAQSSYFIVAGHPEAAFDISSARRDLGYDPQRNWTELTRMKPGGPA